MQKQKAGYLFALGAVLLWSGFILVSRLGGMSELLPNDVIAIRYTTCSLLLLPLWWFRYRFSLFSRPLLLCSMVGGLGYALCAFRGFQLAPASHAAILLPGLMPLGITLLSSWLNGERHTAGKWWSVGVITLGVALLFAQQLQAYGGLSEGHLWLVGASLCWALFSVLVKRWNIGPWQATVSLAMVTCLIYLPVYILYLPKTIVLSGMSDALWRDIAIQAFYQGFLATIVQMLFYVRAVQSIGPASMGSMMAMVPVLAGLSAIVIFDEILSWPLLVGLLLVSLGSWCASSSWPAKLWYKSHQSRVKQIKGERDALREY